MWLAFLKTISSYYSAYECFLWYTWVYIVFVFETEVSCSIQAKIGRKFNLRHFMGTCPHFPEIIWVLWAEAVWELWTGGAVTPHKLLIAHNYSTACSHLELQLNALLFQSMRNFFILLFHPELITPVVFAILSQMFLLVLLERFAPLFFKSTLIFKTLNYKKPFISLVD